MRDNVIPHYQILLEVDGQSLCSRWPVISAVKFRQPLTQLFFKRIEEIFRHKLACELSSV